MPRFAANLSMMFTEVPFLDRFAAARRAGFTAVEFLFPYAHSIVAISEAAQDAHVDIVLFNLPPGNWDAGERGLAALPDRAEEFTEDLTMALGHARSLGVPRLHMMAGNADAGDPRADQRYRAALAEAADAAAPLGIDITIEPINKRDMPGYFLNDFGRAAEIVRSSGRPNVRLQFDIYHRQILHGDVARGLEALLPLTGHIQIASVPLRHEPGTGELDDRYLFGLLDRLCYRGHIGCEYRPERSTLDGLGWFSDFAAMP